MLDFLWYSCGAFYSFLFVVSLLALFVGGMVILFQNRSRTAALIYVALTLLPLLIGVFATMEGYAFVRRTPWLSAEEQELGYHTALVTTYVGGFITLPHLILGLVAYFRKRRDTSSTLTESDRPI